jgi:hypothetical protein
LIASQEEQPQSEIFNACIFPPGDLIPNSDKSLRQQIFRDVSVLDNEQDDRVGDLATAVIQFAKRFRISPFDTGEQVNVIALKGGEPPRNLRFSAQGHEIERIR